MSIFSFAGRYDAAIDARLHTIQHRHDMAAAMTALHRVHINLHLHRFVVGILLEQMYLLGNQLLHLLSVEITPEFHHHLLDIQVFHP